MRFYSSVILNSTETHINNVQRIVEFYSSVILNSTETAALMVQPVLWFYSSVILNSTETSPNSGIHAKGFTVVLY